MSRLVLLITVVVHCARGSVEWKDPQYYIELVNNANSSWTAGYNFPPSTTHEQLKKLLGTSIDENLNLLLPHRHDSSASFEEIEIPESFDASVKWPHCPHIKHIRDQGHCGSCWAVSATSVMTDRLCIASNGKFRAPISAQELMSCCLECTNNGNGCDGGSHVRTWVHAKTHGVVTGGDYRSHIGCQPYQFQPCGHTEGSKRAMCGVLPSKPTKCARYCLNPYYKKNNFIKDHHKMKGAFWITLDEKAIQREIIQRGPVAVAFSFPNDLFHYKSGVYQKVDGEPSSGGHGGKIIGWGKENGLDYWLVVNSWNMDWGDKGMFKIRRMKNGINFEQLVTYGVA